MVFRPTNFKLLAGLTITGLTAGVAVCAYSSYCHWSADKQQSVEDWPVWPVPNDHGICPICLDSFFITIDRLDKLGCGHVFHNSAVFRGHLVRRRMKELRNIYLGIMESIETKQNLIATWNSPRLSYPKFVKCTKISKSAKESKPGHRNIAVNTSICDNDMMERKVKSVEIQTTDYHREMTEQMNIPIDNVLKSASDLDSDTRTANEGGRLEVNAQRSDVNVPKHTIPERLAGRTDVKLLESLELRIPLEEEGEEEGCGTSSFTEVTSLWASPSEARIRTVSDRDINDVKNVDSSSILEVRKNLAMELLWVQQAINSRKNYLKLRSQMD